MSDIQKTIEELRFFKAKLFNGIFSDRIGCFDEAIQLMEELQQQRENSKWIPCSERMPEEHKSMFAKLKGTDKWNNAMFESISGNVNVTVEFEDGSRKTMTLYTCDGEWKTDIQIVKFKVIAWRPLPEPYKEVEQNAATER